MRIGILEPEKFSQEAIALLKKVGEVSLYNGKDLKKFLSSINILYVRLSFNIDSSFIELCPNLKLLCSPTTGHNHLDEKELKSKKITLISLRGDKNFLKSIKATPEHTFGLILALLRKYSIAFSDVKKGIWNRNKYRGEELSGNKVGIVGLGRVGYQVAEYCENFGAQIYWYDKSKVMYKPNWIKLSNVNEVIKKSKIIVLCANYNNNQSPIIGQDQIINFDNKYFINSSRGELVEEEALLEFAKSNRMLGIALDVIKNENSKNKLNDWLSVSQNKNIIITPHIGGMTEESMKKTEIYISKKLIVALKKSIRLN